MADVFEWVYRDRKGKRSDKHGKRCRIIEYGSARKACLVEFPSGERLICRRGALRRLRLGTG